MYYGQVSVTGTAQIRGTESKLGDRYESSKVNGFSVNYTSPAVERYKLTNGNLVGSNTALLLYYTLVSDGVKMDHEFMNKLLGNSKVADEKAPLVTRVIGEYNLPSDSDLAMKAYVARGKYFKEGQLYGMTNLPDNASRDHIATAKRFTGDFFHPENGSLDPSWSLNAIAIYGEYHRWWFNPESVFLHGPSVNKHVSASQTRKVAETIGTYDVVHYNFTATNYYNALYNVPLAK
jgi:hypothetical protein